MYCQIYTHNYAHPFLAKYISLQLFFQTQQIFNVQRRSQLNPSQAVGEDLIYPSKLFNCCCSYFRETIILKLHHFKTLKILKLNKLISFHKLQSIIEEAYNILKKESMNNS